MSYRWDKAFGELAELYPRDAQAMEDLTDLLTRLPVDDQKIIGRFIKAMIKAIESAQKAPQ